MVSTIDTNGEVAFDIKGNTFKSSLIPVESVLTEYDKDKGKRVFDSTKLDQELPSIKH